MKGVRIGLVVVAVMVVIVVVDLVIGWEQIADRLREWGASLGD